MPLTSQPTKTDASIGRIKSDEQPVTNLDTQVPAAEWERIKTSLIDVADEVGNHVGIAGSLNARVDSIEAALSGDLDLGGNNIINVGLVDGIDVSETLLRDGSVALTGDLDLGGNAILNGGAVTASTFTSTLLDDVSYTNSTRTGTGIEFRSDVDGVWIRRGGTRICAIAQDFQIRDSLRLLLGTSGQPSGGTGFDTTNIPTSGSLEILANNFGRAALIAQSLEGASGVETAFHITPTINQSSTAGYNALLVDVTETATGSGEKNIAAFGVGGSILARVDNAGGVHAERLKTNGGTAAVGNLPVEIGDSGNGFYAASNGVRVYVSSANSATMVRFQSTAFGDAIVFSNPSGRITWLGLDAAIQQSGENIALMGTNGRTILETNAVLDTTGEVGVQVTPQVNQSTTDAYIGLLVDVTETATGSGQKDLLSLAVGGITQARIDNAGTLFLGANGHEIFDTSSTSLTFRVGGSGSDALADFDRNGFRFRTRGNGDVYIQTTLTAATDYALELLPVVNQSGAEGYDAIHVDVTESAVGTGEKNFAWFGIGSTAISRIDNAGIGYFTNVIAGGTDVLSALASKAETLQDAFDGGNTIVGVNGGNPLDFSVPVITYRAPQAASGNAGSSHSWNAQQGGDGLSPGNNGLVGGDLILRSGDGGAPNGEAAAGPEGNLILGAGPLDVIEALPQSDTLAIRPPITGGVGFISIGKTAEMEVFTESISTSNDTTTTVAFIGIDDNTVYWVEYYAVAREAGGTDRAMFVRRGLFYREAGGNVTQAGSTEETTTIESAAGFDASFTTSTTSLGFDVTGLAATNVNWEITVFFQGVS